MQLLCLLLCKTLDKMPKEIKISGVKFALELKLSLRDEILASSKDISKDILILVVLSSRNNA